MGDRFTAEMFRAYHAEVATEYHGVEFSYKMAADCANAQRDQELEQLEKKVATLERTVLAKRYAKR